MHVFQPTSNILRCTVTVEQSSHFHSLLLASFFSIISTVDSFVWMDSTKRRPLLAAVSESATANYTTYHCLTYRFIRSPYRPSHTWAFSQCDRVNSNSIFSHHCPIACDTIIMHPIQWNLMFVKISSKTYILTSYALHFTTFSNMSSIYYFKSSFMGSNFLSNYILTTLKAWIV